MTIAMSDRDEENYEGEEDSGAEGEKSGGEEQAAEEEVSVQTTFVYIANDWYYRSHGLK